MARRKTTEELVAELKLFNHHEAAAKLESLQRQVLELREALGSAADQHAKLRASYDSMTDNSVRLSIELEQCKTQVNPGKMDS